MLLFLDWQLLSLLTSDNPLAFIALPLSFYCQHDVTWEEGTSVEELSRSDWPVVMSVRNSLGDSSGRAQPTVGGLISRQLGLVVQEQDKEQAVSIHCLSSCCEFPQWYGINTFLPFYFWPWCLPQQQKEKRTMLYPWSFPGQCEKYNSD